MASINDALKAAAAKSTSGSAPTVQVADTTNLTANSTSGSKM